METNEIPEKQPQPWQPITKKGDIAALGKLGEELGELIAIKERILIQGLDGINPDNNKPNKQALLEETADVIAMIAIISDRFELDTLQVDVRIKGKISFTSSWISILDTQEV